MFSIFLLFVFMLLGCFLLYTYFSNKMYSHRSELMIMSKQNIALKNALNSQENTQTQRPKAFEQNIDINIKFLPPNISSGEINSDCNLLLAPVDTAPKLNTLASNNIVSILDKAEVLNEVWYNVSIVSEKNTNNKGWIKENYLKK